MPIEGGNAGEMEVKNDSGAPLSVDFAGTTTGQTGQQDVDLVASKVASSPLSDRKAFRLKCISSSARALFYGFTSGTTIANGDELAPGEAVDLDIDDTVEVYVICASTQGAGVRAAWTEIA